ncbi:hypothetical protein [Candidatus Thiodictyon syntrophicum]|uniref:hypothetical protein n=1 Tax=Candidatus Thiodictyon syntrophicum TaxID=1166950 RepID=UPI0012FDC7DB|nr:hypothetical protein [Candidatus Thiodictyon syntrophicum]
MVPRILSHPALHRFSDYDYDYDYDYDNDNDNGCVCVLLFLDSYRSPPAPPGRQSTT